MNKKDLSNVRQSPVDLSKFTDKEIQEEIARRLSIGQLTVEDLVKAQKEYDSRPVCKTCKKSYSFSQNCDCKETGCQTCGGLKLIPGRVYGYAGPVCQCGVRHQFNGIIE
jgi:hypothetical protein